MDRRPGGSRGAPAPRRHHRAAAAHPARVPGGGRSGAAAARHARLAEADRQLQGRRGERRAGLSGPAVRA